MNNDERIKKWLDKQNKDNAAVKSDANVDTVLADDTNSSAEPTEAPKSVSKAAAARLAQKRADEIREHELIATQMPTMETIEAEQSKLVQNQLDRKMKQLRRTALILGLPTLLSAIYMFGFSTPLYESTATFTIQSVSSTVQTATPGMGNILSPSSASQDLYWVRELILSRSMMLYMQDKNHFLDHFDHADPLSRPYTIAPLGLDIFSFYQRRVRVSVDAQQGLLKLDVQARSPAESVKFAQDIMTQAEIQANQMLNQINADQIVSLKKDVATAQRQLEDSVKTLSRIQVKRNEIDPEQTATSVYQIIGTLEAQIADARKERDALKLNKLTDSPLLPRLDARITALQDQVATQRSRLTSATATQSIQGSVVEYEAAVAKKKIADARLDATLQTLGTAELQSIQQRRYLSIIARPELPQISQTVHGTYIMLLILVFTILLYGLISTLQTASRLKTR